MEIRDQQHIRVSSDGCISRGGVAGLGAKHPVGRIPDLEIPKDSPQRHREHEEMDEIDSLGRAIFDTSIEERNRLSEKIIGCAIKVHRALGPGLLESAYEACLAHELTKAGLQTRRQVPVPIIYDGIKLDAGYQLDLVVEDRIIVELKSVEMLLPIHEAQLITYLKLTGMRLGLLINFNVALLKNGIKRKVN